MTQQNNSLTNQQIVALAVYLLGGATKALDIEDIAIQAFEISPEKFAWRKFPDRIDLRVVQYALKDASIDSKGRSFLKGSLKHGYMLTSLGVEWAEIAYAKIEDIEAKNRKNSISDKLSLEQARLLASTAFAKFELGDVKDINLSDFQEFVRVNDYFPDPIRQQRYGVIENAVKGVPKLEELWNFLTTTYL